MNFDTRYQNPDAHIETYKEYKAKIKKRRLDKIRNLFNSVDDLSLLPQDMKILKKQMVKAAIDAGSIVKKH